MRSRMSAFVAALVVAFSASAYAQQTLPAPADPRAQAVASLSGKVYGNIDFGGHFSSIDGDEARYQRYRDLRDGPLVDNFLFSRRGEIWTFNAAATKVGYRDQQYTGEYRLVGKVKASFEWNETPTFISRDTRTLYTETSPGVFRLPDSMRAANQANLTTLRDYEAQAAALDVRNTRKTGAFDFVYMANEAVDVKFNVSSALRTGTMPYGAPFGFNNLIELAAPIDQRTTDARASVEWANAKGLLSVGWDAQWFDNAVETLIWDNPLKITDSPPYSNAYQDGRAAATGRMAFWPDNNTQYIHGTASYVTPMRGRVTGYVAIGQASQNAALLPHTSNTLIPEIPLERTTAEAELRNTVVNVQYTARPITFVSFNAKYRYMDVDNRTPHFDPGGRVRFDGVYDATDYPSPEYYSIKRQNVDVDGSIRPFKYTSFKVGYGYAEVDRTFRIWEVTKEGTFRVSADTTGNRYVTFRALFENAKREGEGFDPHNILEHVGEQPGMRHYDVADRDRKRFTVLTTLTPVSIFSVTLSAGVGREEYPGTEFGFQEFDSNQYSIGFDLVPNDRIGLNLAYAWEDYASVTASRSANPPSATDQGFYDPRRNWWMDYDGKVKNFDAALDIAEIAPKTDVRFGFNWSDVSDIYNYRLPADSVLPQATQTGWQLTPVTNELLRGTFDLTYKLSSKIHLGCAYWYERYDVDDFALGEAYTSAVVLPLVPEGGTPATPNTMLLGYAYRPYTANTGMLRLTYLW
jgi:MtrB/PioB family decaheme-associated outer membrane protein